MRHSRTSVLLAIAILAAVASAARTESKPAVLRAGDLTASFSAGEGRPTSLIVRGHELLAAPGELTLQVDKSAPVAVGKGLEAFRRPAAHMV
jgi:hypothetical protein